MREGETHVRVGSWFAAKASMMRHPLPQPPGAEKGRGFPTSHQGRVGEMKPFRAALHNPTQHLARGLPPPLLRFKAHARNRSSNRCARRPDRSHPLPPSLPPPLHPTHPAGSSLPMRRYQSPEFPGRSLFDQLRPPAKCRPRKIHQGLIPARTAGRGWFIWGDLQTPPRTQIALCWIRPPGHQDLYRLLRPVSCFSRLSERSPSHPQLPRLQSQIRMSSPVGL